MALRPPLNTMLVACAAALTNVAFGYDVGVISGSLEDMAAALHLSTIQQEMATSGLNFVSGLGALLLSGNFNDRLGRKNTLFIASLLLFAGSIVTTCATAFPVLLVGRALQGLGSGCGWCACTVYITEVAPREWRGMLVSISDIGINVGILLGFSIDRAVNLGLSAGGPDVRWRVAMGLSALIPLLYCFCCHALLPESPRWLLMVGRESEAVSALSKIGSVDEAQARWQLSEMRRAPKVEEVSWYTALFPTSSRARGLVVTAMVLGLGQQLTGTEAILYYSPRILNQCPTSTDGAVIATAAPAGDCTTADTMFLVNLGVGTCKLLGELVAAALVERTGRRSAMTVSNFIVSLLVASIALKFHLDWPTPVGALSLSLTMLVFSLGPGPLTFVVINEMLPLNLRGKVVSLALLCNRFGSGTIALTFLSLKEAIGVVAAFSLYAALGLGVTVFYHMRVPENSGRSLEDNEYARDGPASDQVGGPANVDISGCGGVRTCVPGRSLQRSWQSLNEEPAVSPMVGATS